MKIAIVANSDWYLYGYRLSLVQELVRLGHQVTLISPPGRYVKQLQSKGLTWLPIKLARRGVNPIRELVSFLQIYRIYRFAHFDTVHHFTIKCVIYGSLAAKIAGVRGVVNSITGLGYMYVNEKLITRFARRLVNFLYRVTLRESIVVFQNPSDRDYFLETKLIREKQGQIIKGSGVDINRFTYQAEPSGHPRVILVSRFLWDKGIGEFIEAAMAINSKINQAEFALVGDVDPGNPASIPVAVLRGWTETGKIKMMGWSDNLPQIYKETNIVCLPSYREGLSKVLIEAAASGRACITTDIPGCRDVVIHGVNGLLVPPKDVKALIESMLFLINNPEVRKKMGQAGRAIAEREFSSKRVNEETIAVYEELAK